MNKLLSILEDNIIGLMIFFSVIAFFIGLGYMITLDTKDRAARFSECIAAGNQYINGDCLK